VTCAGWLPGRRRGSPAPTSPSRSPIANAPAATSPAKAHQCCAGRCTRRPCAPPAPGSPDHAYHLGVKQRPGGKRAALSVARKLARKAYHTLHHLGDQALVPAQLPTAA
jgi:hypothetical protein